MRSNLAACPPGTGSDRKPGNRRPAGRSHGGTASRMGRVHRAGRNVASHVHAAGGLGVRRIQDFAVAGSRPPGFGSALEGRRRDRARCRARRCCGLLPIPPPRLLSQRPTCGRSNRLLGARRDDALAAWCRSAACRLPDPQAAQRRRSNTVTVAVPFWQRADRPRPERARHRARAAPQGRTGADVAADHHVRRIRTRPGRPPSVDRRFLGCWVEIVGQ